MEELFFRGGWVFMSLLSIILVLVLGMSILSGLSIMRSKVRNPKQITRRITYIKEIGLFACITGILAQLISLFSAFKAIEFGTIEITTSQIWSGFKVSIITSIYGLLIYVLTVVIWFVLYKTLLNKTINSA
jgi:hypothetical protein